MSDIDFWNDDEWGGDDSGLPPPPEWMDELSDEQRGLLSALYGEGNESNVLLRLNDIEDPSNVRAIRFGSVVDALQYLIDITGGLSFSHIVEIDVDVYGVEIDDDSERV